MMSSRDWATVALGVVLVGGTVIPAFAQGGRDRGAAEPQTAQDGALIDLTGQWVSIVNEDWRWRMVTPPPGDYPGVPLNEEGRRVADAWNWDQDQASAAECRAYGPPGLIRLPGRIRIAWSDAETLLLEFDAGMQTRSLRFESSGGATGEPTLQGHSAATWHKQAQSQGFGQPRPTGAGGSLRVETTDLSSGYLRRNGVPYSGDAVVEEFFNTFTLPSGDGWLVVTTVVVDPTYLTEPFIISTHFKKEADGSGWNPQPCRVDAPLLEEALPPGLTN
jgi:hypothetical protein